MLPGRDFQKESLPEQETKSGCAIGYKNPLQICTNSRLTQGIILQLCCNFLTSVREVHCNFSFHDVRCNLKPKLLIYEKLLRIFMQHMFSVSFGRYFQFYRTNGSCDIRYSFAPCQQNILLSEKQPSPISYWPSLLHDIN